MDFVLFYCFYSGNTLLEGTGAASLLSLMHSGSHQAARSCNPTFMVKQFFMLSELSASLVHHSCNLASCLCYWKTNSD